MRKFVPVEFYGNGYSDTFFLATFNNENKIVKKIHGEQISEFKYKNDLITEVRRCGFSNSGCFTVYYHYEYFNTKKSIFSFLKSIFIKRAND